MSKLFHCRCAVAINFAKSNKIIAFDESHIEDVRVELSGFTTAVGSVLQGARNPSFVGGRYATRDSTASVTLNETVLDASWITLLDTSYTQLGGSAVNLINKKERDQLESIYGVSPENITGVINVPASQLVSDPAFKTDDAIKVILESQGRGDRQPSPTQPQEQDISKVKDADGFKNTLKNLLKIYKEGDPLAKKTAKDRIDVLLTAGRKKGFIPDIGRETPSSTQPPQTTQQPPQTKQAQESYGVIVLAMDHSPPGNFGGGADGKERNKTNEIAKYLKQRIEAKEPKIKVIIVSPETYVKEFKPGGGKDPSCPKEYDKAWDPYDNYIINEYVNKKQNKATIISIHLDAPRSEGGKGAAVWNLSSQAGVTEVSNKLSNVIEGTYIRKFKESGDQRKVSGVQRWGKCDVRSVRIFQNAPEGYALVEFGVFREVPNNVNQFFTQQKDSFDALVDGLIDFKKSFGTSKDVEGANGSSSSAPAEQTATEPKLPEVGEVPGLLISFWYDVNNYVTKVDYYFIITAASISYGDGTPKLNINAVSAYSVIFNTWKIQDSFAAGSPIDEVLRKVFSSDPTGTYTRDKVEIDKPTPEERLFEQEDLAGLTYNEFKSKLARKFDLQFLASPRADQLGKIKVFREPRVGAYTGSQVFWLGRGLFEKYDISVVSEYNAVNAVGAPNSSYSRNSDTSSSIRFNAPFSSSQRIEFQMPSGQPSMIFKYNGAQYTASKLPPAGWERIQTPKGQNGIQLVLKLPNGETWPKSGNIEMHNLAEFRPGRGTKSIALWDPTSKTFQIKSGSLHTAVDGGIFPNPGGKLISYFKGVVEESDAGDGQVTIKYNRWVSLSIDGRVGEYQIYMTHLHLANRIPRGTQVDVGTVIGTQDGIGAGGARTYIPHMHEEFYINTPGNKTLYLDPFIVYSYSYSRDNNGNKVFDSAARVSQVATGSNNANSGYQQGGGSIQQQMLMKTEFAGIPRALQILPGQTFLHFVTDYNRYLKFDDRDKPNIDPGIPIIRQLQDWMIAKCSFNWAGDLRVSLECYRPRIDAPIYAGQNWESYRKSPGGKGPSLDDYYDYMRSIGDLFYTTVDENGQVISSAKKPFQASWAVTGDANPNNNAQPTAISGKCKYTGNAYSAYKNNIDTIIAQLERAGLNKVALSGILGNISVESTFGTNIIGRGTCDGGSKTERATDSNGNPVTVGPSDCWGIVQWSSVGDRRGRALRAANSDGKNIAGQANFVVEELRTSEKRCTKKFSGEVVQLLNSAQSPTQAAEIFRACYERGEGEPGKRGTDAETIFKGLTCEG